MKIFKHEFFEQVDTPNVTDASAQVENMKKFNPNIEGEFRGIADRNVLLLPNVFTNGVKTADFLHDLKDSICKGNLKNDEDGFVKYERFKSPSGDHLLCLPGMYSPIAEAIQRTAPSTEFLTDSINPILKSAYLATIDKFLEWQYNYRDLEPVIPLNKTSSSGFPNRLITGEYEYEFRKLKSAHIYKEKIINHIMKNWTTIAECIRKGYIYDLEKLGIYLWMAIGFRKQNQAMDKVRHTRYLVDNHMYEIEMPIRKLNGLRDQRVRLIVIVPQTFNLMITPETYSMKNYQKVFPLIYKLKCDGLNETEQERRINSEIDHTKVVCLDMAKAESQLDAERMQVMHKWMAGKNEYLSYISAYAMSAPIIFMDPRNRAFNTKQIKEIPFNKYNMFDTRYDQGFKYCQLPSGHCKTATVYPVFVVSNDLVMQKLFNKVRNKYTILNDETINNTVRDLKESDIKDLIPSNNDIENFHLWKEDIRLLVLGDDKAAFIPKSISAEKYINLCYSISGLVYSVEEPSKYCGWLITKDSIGKMKLRRDYVKVISNTTNSEIPYQPIDIKERFLPRNTLAGLVLSDLGEEHNHYLEELERVYQNYYGDSLLAMAERDADLTLKKSLEYMKLSPDVKFQRSDLSIVEKEVMVDPNKLRWKYDLDEIEHKELFFALEASRNCADVMNLLKF